MLVGEHHAARGVHANRRARAQGVHLEAVGVDRAEILLNFRRRIPDDVIFVLAAVRNHEVDLGGRDSGAVERFARGVSRHRRDAVGCPGDMALANAHFLAQDVLWNARPLDQIGGSFDLRREVGPEPGDPDLNTHGVLR